MLFEILVIGKIGKALSLSACLHYFFILFYFIIKEIRLDENRKEQRNRIRHPHKKNRQERLKPKRQSHATKHASPSDSLNVQQRSTAEKIMGRAPEGCQKSNPVPNKVYSRKRVIENSTVPFQPYTPKYNKNIALSCYFGIVTRAKTTKFSKQKMMQIRRADQDSS